MKFASCSSVFAVSGTPRTLREPSSTPMSNLPPAPFAKATSVRITLSGEERSRLNSNVFPSCWRMISARSNILRNLLGSAPMWQASELASSRAGVTDGLGIKPVARASSETIGLINQRRVSFVGYDEAEDQHFLVETEVHPVNSRVRDALKGKGLLGAADS